MNECETGSSALRQEKSSETIDSLSVASYTRINWINIPTEGSERTTENTYASHSSPASLAHAAHTLRGAAAGSLTASRGAALADRKMERI